jgi:hypothetical protein
MNVQLDFDVDKKVISQVKARKESTIQPRETKSDRKEIKVRIPIIPIELSRFLPYVDDLEVQAGDVTAEISRILNLPFIGKLEIANYPRDMHVPEGGIFPQDWNLTSIFRSMIEKNLDTNSVTWKVSPSDEPLPFDVSVILEKHALLESEAAEIGEDEIPGPPANETQEETSQFNSLGFKSVDAISHGAGGSMFWERPTRESRHAVSRPNLDKDSSARVIEEFESALAQDEKSDFLGDTRMASIEDRRRRAQELKDRLARIKHG